MSIKGKSRITSKWTKPKLVVLVRAIDESVLTTCKMSGNLGPQNWAATCEHTGLGYCAGCASIGAS